MPTPIARLTELASAGRQQLAAWVAALREGRGAGISAEFRPHMRELSSHARLVVTGLVLLCVYGGAYYETNREAVAYIALAAIALALVSYVPPSRAREGEASFRRAWAFVALAGDIVLVTFLVHATGGTQSPFYVIYFLIIVFASVFFSYVQAFIITGLLSMWYLVALVFHADSHGAMALKVGLTRIPFFYLATWFTGVVGAEIERRRRVQALTAGQFRTLAEIGGAALSTLQVQLLLPPLLDKTLSLVSSSAGAVLLPDDEDQLEVVETRGMRNVEVGDPCPRSSIAEQAYRDGTTTVAAGPELEPLRPMDPALANACAQAVPLHRGDRVFGVLYVVDGRPAALRRSPDPLLEVAASQVAMAIQNAGEHEELLQANRRSALLLHLAGSISISHDLPSLLQSLVTETAEGLSAASALMVLRHDSEDRLAVEATSGTLSDDPRLPDAIYAGAGILGRTIEGREPVVVPNLAESALADALLEKLGVQSVVAAPVRVGDRIIGVISVHDKQGGSFDEGDAALLLAIADRAAIAIQNVQLYEQTHQRVRELEALYRLAESIGRSQDLQPSFTLAVSSVAELLGAQVCRLWTVDPRGARLVCMASSDASSRAVGKAVAVSDLSEPERLLGHAFIAADPDLLPCAQALEGAAAVRSVMAAPIRVRGECVGLLDVAHADARAFGQEELRLTSLFAEQLGLAIHRQNLHEQMERRTGEISALFEAVETMSATNSIEEILDFVAHRVRLLFPCDASAVRLVGEDGEELRLVACEEVADDAEIKQALTGLPCSAESCWAIRKDKPFVVGDSEVDFHCQHVDPGLPFRSCLCAPLTAGGKTLGVIQMMAREPRVFTPDHVQLFMALADQSAIAVQRGKLHEEVQRLAVRDGLTGLFNYSYFHEHLRRDLTRARRNDTAVTLIVMDIDHFKQFNDTYGHPRGDMLLKRLAQVILDSIRAVDLPARVGGEEFAVLLPETDKAGALLVAEKLRAAIAATEFSGGGTTPIVHQTMSFGVATFPDDAAEQDELMERADQALYQAKARGRNTVVAV